jgi:putative flippase GtrA
MIRRELSIFLVVGMLTVVVDFATYRALAMAGLLGIDAAKAAGFLIGTLFAYFANRFWTFGHARSARGSAGRFIVLYASTLVANVAVNALALKLFGALAVAVPAAFVLATGVSASLNFIGMKLFVFRAGSVSENQ